MVQKSKPRGKFSKFLEVYRASCVRMGNIRPDSVIQRTAHDGYISTCVDKLSQPQWDPIIAALETSKDLRGIRLWSKKLGT
jgi:hypothetical protein